MIHYYSLQIDNLARDIESQEETKKYKLSQVDNIDIAVSKRSEEFNSSW